jgi:ArsR family transcriptional regulator
LEIETVSTEMTTQTDPTATDTAADCCSNSENPAPLPGDAPLPVVALLRPEPRLGLPAPQVADVVATAGLLADRTRASILRMLADGPLCVCELASALNEKQNNVSMHLARLRDAGLVRAVRHSGDARWMFYERDEERCHAAAATLAGLLR